MDHRRTPTAGRATRACLYLVYLLGAVVVIIYFAFYRPYIAGLSQTGDRWSDFNGHRYMSAHTVRQLGYVAGDSDVRFTNRVPAKTAGTVRICALGDSNTAGDEAGPGLDYPTYLQREFDAPGAQNVEVLNFGNSWHGFSQVVVMWEDVARRFGCDVIVIKPYSYWWQRDTSFNHAAEVNPYYLHARFVASGEGVERLEVSGATHQSRFERYHAFLPRWRYLRYDRQAPALIRSMLPTGLEISNPFYHVRDPRAESYALHGRLLARIAGDGIPVLILVERDSDHENHARALMSDAPENVGFARATYDKENFPYMAPIWHRSGWGNQMAARAVARNLLDDPPDPLPRLVFHRADGLADWDEPPALESDERIAIAFGDEEVGVIVSVHDRDHTEEQRHFATFANSGIAGLLAIVAPGGNVMDACLLPLAKHLAPHDEVEVRFDDGVAVTLGRPRLLAQGAALWILEVAGSYCSNINPLHVPVDTAPGRGAATIVVGDNRLPVRRDGGWLELGHPGEPMFQFASLGHYPADVGALGGAGEVAFVFEGDGRARRVPFARWQVEARESDVEILAPLPVAIAIVDGRATLVGRRATIAGESQ